MISESSSSVVEHVSSLVARLLDACVAKEENTVVCIEAIGKLNARLTQHLYTESADISTEMFDTISYSDENRGSGTI